MGKQIKRTNKTKEQLLAELRANLKFQEKMQFTREVFYPQLITASKSVDDTLSFLSSISTVMMETFLGMMRDKKFSELNLIDKLDPKDEKYEDIKTLLNLFNEQTVFEARDILEGMKREIQMWCNDEMKERKLESLQTKWLDQT